MNKMKKVILSCMIAISALLIYAGVKDVQVTEAASTSYETIGALEYNPVTIGSKKYYLESWGSYMYQPIQTSYSLYNLKVYQKGTSTTIATNVLRAITNKNVIYYSRLSEKKCTIYRYNLSTGARTEIYTSKKGGLEVLNCNGKYLYYGIAPYGNSGEEYLQVYAYALSNGNNRHIADGKFSLVYKSGYVILKPATSETGNWPAYVCKQNGTKVKQLEDCFSCKIKGKKIYCVVFKDGDSTKRKVVSYSLSGGNKKTVVGWTTSDKKISPYL